MTKFSNIIINKCIQKAQKTLKDLKEWIKVYKLIVYIYIIHKSVYLKHVKSLWINRKQTNYKRILVQTD